MRTEQHSISMTGDVSWYAYFTNFSFEAVFSFEEVNMYSPLRKRLVGKCAKAFRMRLNGKWSSLPSSCLFTVILANPSVVNKWQVASARRKATGEAGGGCQAAGVLFPESTNLLWAASLYRSCTRTVGCTVNVVYFGQIKRANSRPRSYTLSLLLLTVAGTSSKLSHAHEEVLFTTLQNKS